MNFDNEGQMHISIAKEIYPWKGLVQVNTRNKVLVNSFVTSMAEKIRTYADGRLSEAEIRDIAEQEVNRLDFDNEWQMHKSIDYFAKKAVDKCIKTADEEPYPSIEELFTDYSGNHKPEEAFSDTVGREEI